MDRPIEPETADEALLWEAGVAVGMEAAAVIADGHTRTSERYDLATDIAAKIRTEAKDRLRPAVQRGHGKGNEMTAGSRFDRA